MQYGRKNHAHSLQIVFKFIDKNTEIKLNLPSTMAVYRKKNLVSCHFLRDFIDHYYILCILHTMWLVPMGTITIYNIVTS